MTTAPHQFQRCQPEFAAHGIATFPVRIADNRKAPAVRNYLRIGLRGSAKLATDRRFATADAFGFAAGQRSDLTVLDVDSADEQILADAIDRHGTTPLIVRSGSGHFQGWYKHNGERRLIRPNRDVPIDILGGGYVVAPTSIAPKGRYEIIAGSLDDLDGLPVMQNVPVANENSADDITPAWGQMRDGSGRNNELFRQLGREAHACHDFDQLLDRARILNDQFGEPLDPGRVTSTARSVWRMTCDGRNRFGQRGAWFSGAELSELLRDPHLHALLSFLRWQNGPDARFLITNSLQKTRHFETWSRADFFKARRRAVQQDWLKQITKPSPGNGALYGWGSKALGSTATTFMEDSSPIPVTVAKVAKDDERSPIPVTVPDFARFGGPQ